MKIKNVIFGLIVAGVCSMSWAAQINLSKVRVNLENGRSADYLKLVNESETDKAAVDIDIRKWTQRQNENGGAPEKILTDTGNMIASPETMVLLPKQEKIVRIMASDYEEAKKDYSYRIIVNQLPSNEVGQENNAIRLLFKFDVPVFVYGGNIKNIGGMNIEKKFITENGKIYLYIKNNDSQHIQISELKLGEKKIPVGQYLLPGIYEKFEMPEGFNIEDASATNLVVVTDKGDFSFDGKTGGR